MQVPVPCSTTIIDYTAVILATISMFGNVLLGYLTLKYRGEVAATKDTNK